MVLLVGVFSAASAQNLDTHPMRGFMPNMEQLSSPVDNIDVAGGKLKLQIPLASLPRGKGGTGFDLNLEYESRIFDLDPHTERVWDGQNLVDYKYAHIEPITGTGGWTYNASNIYIEPELKNEVNENYDCPSMDDANHIRYRLLLPDGSMHILYMRGYEFMDQTGDGYYGLQIFNGSSNLCAQHWGWPEQYNGWLTLYTNDGSFLKLEIYVNGSANTWNEARLFFPDGRRIALWPSVMQIYDANNNYITIANVCESNCNELTTVIFDEPNNPNRAITIRYNTPHNQPSSYVLDRDEIEAPGPNGLVRYYVDWESMRVGGDNRTYSIGDHPVEGLKYNGLDYWIWTVKYIHLPLPETQANYPLPLGYPPANEKDSYEFGYWGNDANGFGFLDYMRIPSGAEYEYS
jgi:hypothetical protein